jgi:hypothetical protein
MPLTISLQLLETLGYVWLRTIVCGHDHRRCISLTRLPDRLHNVRNLLTIQ